jgi:chromosomal replication initiation ATPase DnaA
MMASDLKSRRKALQHYLAHMRRLELLEEEIDEIIELAVAAHRETHEHAHAVEITETVLGVVCAECGVHKIHVLAQSRGKRVSEARFICMYLLHRHYGWSGPDVARLLGRHHGTVYNAVERVDEWVQVYPAFRERMVRIMKQTPCKSRGVA